MIDYYDIFISYKRRDTSSAIAAFLYKYLTSKGYKVFFDRNEIRQGRFNEQLYNHIENAKDIIILLEETSLKACFNEIAKDAYKTDWFCKEVMHALQHEQDKNIIPLLLGGYNMPEDSVLPNELKALPFLNAINFDAAEIDEIFQKYFINKGYLSSKPRDNAPVSDSLLDNVSGVSDFLFFTNQSCDIFEYGEKIHTLSVDNNENNPFRYEVERSGDHRFLCINNDTYEKLKIIESVETGAQKYIELKWSNKQNIWDITGQIIEAEENPETLYEWGCGLFYGTTTHLPNEELAFKCLSKSVDLGNDNAKDFFINEYVTIFDRDLTAEEVLIWLEKASLLGSSDAKLSLADYFKGSDNEKAFNLYQESAATGNTEAMCKLGHAYQQGIENVISKDETKAVELYQLAIDNGSKTAYTLLGNCYRYGIGVVQNDNKAIELYKKAVEPGQQGEIDPWSEYVMGLRFLDGDGIEKDEAKALEWFYKAARDGNGETRAISRIGYFHLYGISVEQNYEEAYKWLKVASNKGDAGACYYLGFMYLRGWYVEQNFSVAIDLFAKAADVGWKDAMYYLGLMYLNGDGTDKDEISAIKWFRKGAELGHPRCQYCSAISYFDSCLKNEYDYSKALELFEQAASQNDEESLYMLGEIYIGKIDAFKSIITIDNEKAFAYYMRAAELDHPVAQYNIARMLEYQDISNFVPNYKEALHWYHKAAENEYVLAYEGLRRLYCDIYKDNEEAIKWGCKAIENGCLLNYHYYMGRYGYVPSEYINSLQIASQKGYQDANLFLFELYNNGIYKCNDKNVALKLLENVASNGNDQAKYRLALFYLQKHYPLHKYYVKRDVHKAVELMTTIIKSHEANPRLISGAVPEWVIGSYFNLAELYKLGKYVEKDIDKALSFFNKAAQNGLSTALKEIHSIQLKRHKDVSEFYKTLPNKELLKFALANISDACKEMSRRFKEGDKQKPNDERAEYWHKKGQGKFKKRTIWQRLCRNKNSIFTSPTYQEPQKWFWQK